MPLSARLLALLALIGAMHGQDPAIPHDGVVVTNNGKIITFEPVHASAVRSLVEDAIQHTANYLREGTPREDSSITVSWHCTKTITVLSQVDSTKDVAITKIEFQDFGPGANNIGDILILASDANGHVYRCEKYDPGFCDAVHSIVRLHFAK